MRKIAIFLLVMTLLASNLWAASSNFSFRCRTKIVRGGGHVYYQQRQHSYRFTIEVISDHRRNKPEYHHHRHPFIQAYSQERYSVTLHNPMPVRVAVNLMIDGLNSITGSPCTPENGHKWLLEPNSSYTVMGWQVSKQTSRRFYFTNRENSYAAWRSNDLGQDLTVKCGVISAAYFWSRSDIERYFERNPIHEGPVYYRYRPYFQDMESSKKSESGFRGKIRPPAPGENNDAGTGMGENHGNQVESVGFDYDMGMYQPYSTVKIYYDFIRHPKFYYPHQHRHYPENDSFAPEKP